MLTNFITALIAFLAGLYVDSVRQMLAGIVEWVSFAEEKTEDYEIKIEDYYDGRRDSE